MKRIFLILLCIIFASRVSAETGYFYPADRFSNSIITDLCQDKYGNVWIATDYGLNKFDGYQFTTYLHEESDPSSLCHNAVVTLLCDSDGNLWIGTNRGLDRYDFANDSFVHYPFPNDYRPRIPHMIQQANGDIFVSTSGFGAYLISRGGSLKTTIDYTPKTDEPYYWEVFEDSKGRFWRCSDNDIILRMDKAFYKFGSTVGIPFGFVERGEEILIFGRRGIMLYRNAQMLDAGIDMSVLESDDVIFSQVEADADGNIYIGTRGHGLYRIPVGSRRMERVNVDVSGVNLNTGKVTDLLFDNNKNLWLGLERKGLLLVTDQQSSLFNSWSFERQNIQLGSFITSVCEGDNGITWCTVQSVGIYGFDANGMVVAHPAAPPAVEFIYRDKWHHYWVGTDKGLYSYDPLTGRYQLKQTFEGDKINEMTCDSEGNLYISVFARGFSSYNIHTGARKDYSMVNNNEELGQLCNDWILCMTSDYNGMVWMGTSHGVSCFDPKTQSFLSQGWPHLLEGIMCFSICELLDGNIAIGTDQGLYLYDRSLGKTVLFPDSEQLKNKIVNYIVQSNNGDVWCSTSMGLWQYSNERKSFIGHINGNGLEQKEYLHGVGMHTDTDQIYFGHNDGLVSFSPKQVPDSPVASRELVLTSFLVGNVPVNAGMMLNDVVVTDKTVPESDEFTLSHLDHFVSMSFSQFEFCNSYNVTLEYRINEGEWVKNTEGSNSFTLSFLQPGNYRVEVRASLGSSFSPVKFISVTVNAPWYRTPLAYTLYILAVLLLAGYVVYAYRRQMNRLMNEEKMKFLINCTHDIRSPLTLIMSPLANLKRRVDVSSSDIRRDIDTIEHNANRILNLVNQILDMRKMDKEQMQLHCQCTDLVRFVSGICKMYEYNAQERRIQFNFNTGDLEKLDVWIDRNQFDKVMTNLLSNAFKYSFDGGKIDITLRQEGNLAKIEVKDTGIGLDKDTVKHLFDRFYQGSNSRRLRINGTGIGLNLCKMIVDMHQGTIEAENRTDGQRGSVFTITLPLGNSHLSVECIEDTPSADVGQNTVQHTTGKGLKRVLLVDDDHEITSYISAELGSHYRFGICHNGRDGLKELLTREYDLVVSDVMMPEMDGFSMLRMIKSNLNISHIPVIMLTSKSDVGNRLEGLEYGADAFLAKPFNMEELHMNIENLIVGRQRLKGKFSGAQQQADKIEIKEVKGNDELLMERIMKAVNKNISDSSFNVDVLTSEVGISRAQLHRKMKEMTGISTSEFIRNIRLEQAARLLREQKINVTQVAYTVGFSNLAHFSTIFRKHFGMSPTEYMERDVPADDKLPSSSERTVEN